MDERAAGIILRVRPFSETSAIVHWLTAVSGRIATIAKGARRPKSPFLGKLDLFFECDFSFQRSRRSDLHLLKEAVLRETHPALRQDLGRLKAAVWFAVLIEQGTETETPLDEFYLLMKAALNALARPSVSLSSLIFAFEMRFLQLSGVSAELSESRLHPRTQQFASELLENNFCALPNCPAHIADELNAYLRMAIASVLGKLPPQRERALQPV